MKTKIYWGIPLNPPYLDGKVKGQGLYFDRDHNTITYGQSARLQKVRTKQREEWLKQIEGLPSATDGKEDL